MLGKEEKKLFLAPQACAQRSGAQLEMVFDAR